MTKEVITVTPETPVEKLAAIFCEKKISGAPVVDGEGNLIGVVTESDLIDQSKKIHIPTMISLLDSVIFLESSKNMSILKKTFNFTLEEINNFRNRIDEDPAYFAEYVLKEFMKNNKSLQIYYCFYLFNSSVINFFNNKCKLFAFYFFF